MPISTVKRSSWERLKKKHAKALDRIKYLVACRAQLEKLCFDIVERNPGVKIPLSGGIDGNEYLTPYNTGEFHMRLATSNLKG